MLIDAGTAFVKVALLDGRGVLKNLEKIPEPIVRDPDDEFKVDLDVDQAWSKVRRIVKSWGGSGLLENVAAVSATAARMAVVFTDAEGNTLYGGPNVDIRGIETADEVEEELEDYYERTGRNPPLIFPLARLLWFRDNEEDAYEQIAHVLTLNQWFLYKFSGVAAAEVTSAVDTMMLNVRENAWDDQVVEVFDLNPDILPDVHYPGDVMGNVDASVAEELGLGREVLVVCGAGDTQAALLGMGVTETDQVGVIAGTTAPCMWVRNEPTFDPEKRYWTNSYTRARWVVEANVGPTGSLYEWFLNKFFGESEGIDHGKLDDAISATLNGESSAFAFLGPDKMAFGEQTGIKPGMFVFPSPASPVEEVFSRGHLGRAVLENVAFAVKLNLDAVAALVGKPPAEVVLSGGLARSHAFRRVLAGTLNQPVKVPKQVESSLVGLYLLCKPAVDPEFSVDGFLGTPGYHDVVEPDPVLSGHLASAYRRWTDLKETRWDVD